MSERSSAECDYFVSIGANEQEACRRPPKKRVSIQGGATYRMCGVCLGGLKRRKQPPVLTVTEL